MERPLDDEGVDGWYAARVLCRFCGLEYVSVFPVETPGRSLECPRCHLCESDVIEYLPPGDGDERAGDD